MREPSSWLHRGYGGVVIPADVFLTHNPLPSLSSAWLKEWRPSRLQRIAIPDGPSRGRRHNLLTLNLDILSLVFSELYPTEALQVAKTCRAAHALALPYVLTEVTITHRGPDWSPEEDHLVLFCAYMLADATRRLPLLKCLRIESRSFRPLSGSCISLIEGADNSLRDYSTAQHLVPILRLSTNLRELSIQDAEEVFRAVPKIPDAIIELTGLNVIRFRGVHRQTMEVLSRMRSRPRTVDCLIYDDGRDPGCWPDYGPITLGKPRFLHNFTASLVTLKLHGRCEIICDIEPDTVWSEVRSLDLGSHVINGPSGFAAFSRAFPQLRCLSLSGYSIYTRPTSVVLKKGHFPYLDFVTTCCPIAIGRTIRRLEFHTLQSSLVQHTSVTEFLRLSSPVVLACEGDSWMLQCVQAATIPSLRFLQLFAMGYDVLSGGLAQRLRYLLGVLFPKLKSTRLRAVTLTADGLDTALDAQSVLQYAADIALTVPSLQYIGLQGRADRGWDEFHYQWFCVAARPLEEPPVLQKLSSREADALELELLATPRD